MTEITASLEPRTFIPRSGRIFYINHRDALFIMCKACGGCMAIVMHVQPGNAGWLPAVRQCKCEEVTREPTSH